MDLQVVVPVCIVAGAFVVWGVVALVKALFKTKTTKEYEERIKELNDALETTKTLAADRRLALDNKTKDIYDLEFSKLRLEKELDKQKDKYSSLLSQKKSTEVRVGQISEQIAPFLHAWPYKAGNFRFLGSPIDGVSFEEDCVVFVEIKTGKGRLSPSQLRIRKLVREGRVKWVEFRVDPDGINIKEG
jgi:predicted Holliday junction resolvase-like endonuclease